MLWEDAGPPLPADDPTTTLVMTSAIGYADPMSTHEDTAPITYTEALTVTRAMLDAAATVSVLVEYETSGIVRDPSVARQCRAAADFLEVMHKAASPSILRHVADRFDPPTVPAEPDLTTPEGWIAEAERADEWSDLPTAFMGAQMNALSTALSDCPEAGVAVKLAAIYGYSSRAVRR